MEATRRYWEAAAVAVVLAGLAVVLGRPVLLVGATVVGGWLVATGYAFARDLRRLEASLSVEQSRSRAACVVEDAVEVTLGASVDPAVPLAVSVAAAPPVSTAVPPAERRRVELAPGASRAAVTFEARPLVAGTHAFGPTEVRAADRTGLLRETFEVDPAPPIEAGPRRPRDVHVGTGGTPIASAYGEHPTRHVGTGLDPAEIREYAPGDSARRIDWNATARLARPHVREFEAETDRRTVLLLDRRGTTATGPAGETAFDFLREVALGVLGSARELGDPVGLTVVDETGPTDHRPPAAAPTTYDWIERTLRSLAPPTAADADDPGPVEPARARRVARALADEETPFARTLGPFFGEPRVYFERVATEPLFRGANHALARSRGTVWTVLLTDDERRTEVLETVKLARRRDGHVLVFLAPHVLFEPTALADLEGAYDRYLDFESFRRDLEGLDRVAAFEVAPGDHLESILAERRRLRAPAGV